MAKQKDFDSFLSNIEPSKTTKKYISRVQNNLRDYLKTHEEYKNIHVQTFLSGSYAKNTSIRPTLYDGNRDVDIVVETNYFSDSNSCDVLQELKEVLEEKELYSSAKLQSHSIGIELEGIDVDIVPVILSDEEEKFCIGSSDKDEWKITDPKGHTTWSSEVNSNSAMKYKPLVKMLKWWRRTNCPEETKYPKGIVLEKIIADNLADSEVNTEEYLIATMQSIVDSYKEDYVDEGIMPEVFDPCIEENDLLAKYKLSDFEAFIMNIEEHLNLIAENGTGNEVWKTILGNEFPSDSYKQKTSYAKSGYTNYRDTEEFIEDIAAVNIRYKLKIDCTVMQDGWNPFGLLSFLKKGGILRHNKKLDFFIVSCDVPPPYSIYWKVRNVGEEAEKKDEIRGQIHRTNDKHQIEHTSFKGSHYVECYIVKNDNCVAKDRIEVPIGMI